MTRSQLRVPSFLALAALLSVTSPAIHARQLSGFGNGNFGKPMQHLARQITAALQKAHKQTVGIVPLRQQDNPSMDLGTIVADALETRLVADGAVDVVRRGMLEAHVRPLAANELGAIDSRVAKQLAAETGVDAIVTGTISVRSYRIIIECRLFDAPTGKSIATAQTDVDLDPDVLTELERLVGPGRPPQIR
jgi:TolB-like protein